MLHSTLVGFWNIWGHRLNKELHEELDTMVSIQDIDILCLTEVTHMARPYVPTPKVHMSTNLSEPPMRIDGLEQLVTNFNDRFLINYHSPCLETRVCKVTGDSYHNVGFGSVLMFRKNLYVVAAGDEVFTYTEMTADGLRTRHCTVQWLVYDSSYVRYLVMHLHGLWLPDNTKGNDIRRNRQSHFVRDLANAISDRYDVQKVVFGGDLNLSIDNAALTILEQGRDGEEPWQNLIKTHGYNNTRTKHYRKFHIESESKHADYAFVSPNVEVHGFGVETTSNASDHAPLLLTFS